MLAILHKLNRNLLKITRKCKHKIQQVVTLEQAQGQEALLGTNPCLLE